MAHFAELDSNNQVLRVIVVDNKDTADVNGQEDETIGIAFCRKLFGGTWRQTSYNGNLRKNYAGIGYTFDADRDAFIPPKPFTSWVLDESTCQWTAPTPMPTDGQMYRWDEDTTNWIVITNA